MDLFDDDVHRMLENGIVKYNHMLPEDLPFPSAAIFICYFCKYNKITYFEDDILDCCRYYNNKMFEDFILEWVLEKEKTVCVLWCCDECSTVYSHYVNYIRRRSINISR